MADNYKSEEDWCLLPEFVDLERFIAVAPSSICNISWYSYNKRIQITSLRMSELPIFFMIAETPEKRLIGGLDDFIPMGSSSLHRFLQLYWRYMFEDILKNEGYALKEGNHSSYGSFLMCFIRKEVCV